MANRADGSLKAKLIFCFADSIESVQNYYFISWGYDDEIDAARSGLKGRKMVARGRA